MTSDTKFRLAFTVLMLALLLLIARNLFAGPWVTLNLPKIVMANPRATIPIQWRIPRDDRNLYYIFSYESDNGEAGLSRVEINGKSPSIFPVCTMKMTRACMLEVFTGVYYFQICVFQRDGKYYCDKAVLEVH